MYSRVTTKDILLRRSPPLVPVRECFEQQPQALRNLEHVAGRMEARERRVAQNVDLGRSLVGQSRNPVGQGVEAQLPHEGGRLRPQRCLVVEGR